jgi:hypothetical protein
MSRATEPAAQVCGTIPVGSLKTNIEIEAIWQAFVNRSSSVRNLNTAILNYGKFELIIRRASR